jgi:hypothetical protein
VELFVRFTPEELARRAGVMSCCRFDGREVRLT